MTDADGGVERLTASDLAGRVRRAVAEPFEIVEYDPRWPAVFEAERAHLLSVFPEGSVVRIEHVGSTAVPGLAAKPIVDVLVGVTDLAPVRERVAPDLEAQGYDYFWSPSHGNDVPPFYAFFIKRAADGTRTHHIHVVEMTGFDEQWGWVVFRDHLRAHREDAAEYEQLKRRLAREFAGDRVGYTEAKSGFIAEVMRRAAVG